jgi:hypothetical protein
MTSPISIGLFLSETHTQVKTDPRGWDGCSQRFAGNLKEVFEIGMIVSSMFRLPQVGTGKGTGER